MTPNQPLEEPDLNESPNGRNVDCLESVLIEFCLRLYADAVGDYCYDLQRPVQQKHGDLPLRRSR